MNGRTLEFCPKLITGNEIPCSILMMVQLQCYSDMSFPGKKTKAREKISNFFAPAQ